MDREIDRHPLSIHAGTKIRLTRLVTGVTQQELAEKIGLGVLHLQNLEDAKVALTLDELANIATVLGVPITGFFEGFENKSS